jgi:hypothetical protein
MLDYIFSLYSIIGSQYNGDTVPKNYKNITKIVRGATRRVLKY